MIEEGESSRSRLEVVSNIVVELGVSRQETRDKRCFSNMMVVRL